MPQSHIKQAGFNGLMVAAFESRRAEEIGTLIARFGGIPRVAASMREVPVEDHFMAKEFAARLQSGQIDWMIFMTGVGTRMLIQTLEQWLPREDIVKHLAAVKVVARGWKTVRALDEAGVRIDIKVPEPNTWQELIRTLDSLSSPPGSSGLSGARVALQEYGEPNRELVRELRARGVEEVVCVPVYRWAAPEDTGPMEVVIREIIDGHARVVLFTNAVQVVHVMQLAAKQGVEPALRKALGRCAVCSIGPTCSSELSKSGLAVDLEPENHKMGSLVHDAAQRAPGVVQDKDQNGHARAVVLAPHLTAASRPPWFESRFMKACRMEPVDMTPVWLMRQAGRYMKEYRDLRARVPFLELCKNPQLAAEVTVTAAERIGADAAILFADLLLIAEPLGFHLDYERGGGPRVAPVVRSPGDVKRLLKPAIQRQHLLDSLSYVFEAVRQARANLDSALPLIGFAGAPFTLASYLIEGGSSKAFLQTKTFMFGDPGAFHGLMEHLAVNTAFYINGQIEAGVQAVQVFDSWAGCLSPADYKEFVLPHMRRLFRSLKPGVPVIHFGAGTGSLLEWMRRAGGSMIGLDFRVDLDKAWKKVGARVGVQGNLDPAVLFTGVGTIREHTLRILRQAGGRPGHVFNLGHGVLPATPVEHVRDLVKIVHEESARLMELKKAAE